MRERNPPKRHDGKMGEKKVAKEWSSLKTEGSEQKTKDRKIEKEKERKKEDGEKEKGKERAYTQAHMQIPSSLG